MTEIRTYKDYKNDVLEQLKKGLTEDPNYMLKIANKKTPNNPIRNTFYRGINFLACWFFAEKYGFRDSRYYTYKDITHMGLHLKAKDPTKGYVSGDQKSLELMYFIPHYLYEIDSNGNINWYKGHSISERDYSQLSDEDKKRCKPKTIKFYVFNAEQIDGIEPEIREDKGYSIDLANHIAESIGTKIEWDSNKEDPCYSSKYDKVYMPDSNAFDNENEMNAVALHELSHSTGHKTRLDRKLGNRFGSEEYAFEELIAECSATMLCAYLGIEPIVHDNHKAYVKSWLGALDNDPNALLDAFKMAERAQQYIIDKADLSNYSQETVEQVEIEQAEEKVEDAVPEAVVQGLDIEEPIEKPKKRTRKAKAKKQIATLEGLNVVITGKLQKFGRKTAFNLIKNKGGIPSDSLTKETNILVIADEKVGSNTGKMQKAEKYGTKIMGENEFYTIVLGTN